MTIFLDRQCSNCGIIRKESDGLPFHRCPNCKEPYIFGYKKYASTPEIENLKSNLSQARDVLIEDGCLIIKQSGWGILTIFVLFPVSLLIFSIILLLGIDIYEISPIFSVWFIIIALGGLYFVVISFLKVDIAICLNGDRYGWRSMFSNKIRWSNKGKIKGFYASKLSWKDKGMVAVPINVICECGSESILVGKGIEHARRIETSLNSLIKR